MASTRQEKAIIKLYNESLKNGIQIKENEDFLTILDICKEKGQFVFHINSYWGFVKTTHQNKNCVRMIFALKNEEEGKVHNIERILSLIRDLERVLVFVDSIAIKKISEFTYIDVIKYS